MTRAVLRLGTATVQVLITQHSDGTSIGTAVLELHDRERRSMQIEPYHKVKAPSAKEAWADLATWIGGQLGEVTRG